jgi:hypothetical protein
MNKKKRTATPLPVQDPSSLQTSEPALPPSPANEPLPTSDAPQAGEFHPSYRPPAVVPSTPTPLPSETEESPSLTKSTPTSTAPKTSKEKSPVPSSDSPPAKCPVQGEGGADFLNWSAKHYTDLQFRETYESRAAHMIQLHVGKLFSATVKRLETLL